MSRGRWRHAAVATTMAAVSIVTFQTTTPAAVHAAPPEHRVYMVTDSVGLGAKNAVPAAFPPDWDVTVDGTPALFVEQLESKHVRTRMATTPSVFGDYAVVAGGYNYPYWDPARFDRSIDSMIAALEQAGVKYVFWVTLREVKPQYITASAWNQVQPYYWYFPEVNAHLRDAVARHPDLSLIDWAAIADRPGLTYDAIHLNTFGAAEYAANIARVVMSTADRLAAGSVTTVHAKDIPGVPADASAVSLNLTVTNPRAPGFLTAYPCDVDRPEASNLNFRSDNTVAGAAIVPLAADGTVCIYTSSATHLIVDVMGAFAGNGAYVRAGPTRLTDTRDLGVAGLAAHSPLRVQIPDTLAGDAAILNVTAVGGPNAGFITVYTCGDPIPGTSNVNFPSWGVVPNLVIAQPDATGGVCLFANQPTYLVVDLFGGLTPGAVHLHPPTRVLDTRLGGSTAPLGTTVVAPAAPGGTPDAGVLVNLTTTQPATSGFLTGYPCGQAIPPTSNLNVVPQQTVANFATVRPDADGNICVFTSTTTEVVVDVMGTVGAAFTGLAVPARAFDSRTT